MRRGPLLQRLTRRLFSGATHQPKEHEAEPEAKRPQCDGTEAEGLDAGFGQGTGASQARENAEDVFGVRETVHGASAFVARTVSGPVSTSIRVKRARAPIGNLDLHAFAGQGPVAPDSCPALSFVMLARVLETSHSSA